MKFKYSFFISYRTKQGPLAESFINQMKKALDSEVIPRVDRKSYIDREKLSAGGYFKRELFDGLANSLCFIPVLSPSFFNNEKPFCTREYLAMKKISKMRNEILQIQKLIKETEDISFIIPVTFRQSSHLPSCIDDLNRIDFSKFSLTDQSLTSISGYNLRIQDIAAKIQKLSELYSGLDESVLPDISSIKLPSTKDAIGWLNNQNKHELSFPEP